MDSRQIESVRGIVLSTLASLGIPKAPWFLVADSDLPRRREMIGKLPPTWIRVVWVLDKHQLEFYDNDHRLLVTVSVPEPSEAEAL